MTARPQHLFPRQVEGILRQEPYFESGIQGNEKLRELVRSRLAELGTRSTERILTFADESFELDLGSESMPGTDLLVGDRAS